MDEQAYMDREAGLERGLTKAQIIMIGLGGAIGTGLFMGSGCTTVRTRRRCDATNRVFLRARANFLVAMHLYTAAVPSSR